MDELVERRSKRSRDDLTKIAVDPEDPAVFQLSGGTTGIPKLIPRTHNDYVYNSKMAAAVTGVGPEKILLNVLPLAHNLPLACPGLQGYLLHGGKVVVANTTRGEDIFRLIERHRVTHIAVVPALLIRLINDPAIENFDLSSLASHPEWRPAAAAGSPAPHQGTHSERHGSRKLWDGGGDAVVCPSG